MRNYRWIIEPIVATCCCVAVLLVTAQSPSSDEIYRGVPSAFVGWMMGKLFARK